MKPINEMKINFESRSCNESFARSAVASFVSVLDPNVEELSDIKTAVSEAVTNSIIHGYENKDGMIHINCKLHDKTLDVEIVDYGKGIENIDIAKQPLYTSKPELDRSGMGFTIMESFMDEIRIESILGMGTKILMKKRIGEQV